MAVKEIDKLQAAIADLNEKLKFLTRVQQLIVSHMAPKNQKFMVEYMAMALLQPQIREGISDNLLGVDSEAPDDLKTLMMEINEVFSDKKGKGK